MEGDSAAVAIYGTQIEKLKKEGKEPTAENSPKWTKCAKLTIKN